MSKTTMSNENITLSNVIRKRAKHKSGNKNVFEVFNTLLLLTRFTTNCFLIRHFKQFIDNLQHEIPLNIFI